jgi:hypothetical protein
MCTSAQPFWHTWLSLCGKTMVTTLADGSTFLATYTMAAAKRFFARALHIVGHAPEKVTTDGHAAYPRAVRETLGPPVRHRTSR